MIRFPAFFCALRLTEVPFLHYVCKANQKKFCFIRRFWKTTVLSGEKGNEIKKYLKISVIFALSRVEGSEWRYFTKCRPQSWQKYFSPLREIAGRKALLPCLVSGKRAENAASIALLAGAGEARTPRRICSMDRRSRRRHFFRARFYRSTKIRFSLILPLRESCWGVSSPNPANVAYAEFAERLSAYNMSQAEFIRQAITGAAIRPIITVSPVNDELLAAVGKLTAEWQDRRQLKPDRPDAERVAQPLPAACRGAKRAECKWATNIVVHILENREYTGCLVNFKTEKLSYKVKHSVENPPEKQVIFENHHEPIIDTQTWERVQELRKQRKRPNRYDEVGLFSGRL